MKHILFGFTRYSRMLPVDRSELGRIRSYSKEVEEGVNNYTHRSHTCGELSSQDVGKHVSLCGWLEFRRLDKFGVIRDAYGTTQLIIPEERKDLLTQLAETPLESVISVEGMVNRRPDSQVNQKMSTGDVEVVVTGYKTLNKVIKQLPFNLREFNKAKESLRMKHRYLDLRFPQMQKNLRLRSQILLGMRDFLINYRSFVEVETPTLFKKTPGGAQEFIVATRFPGEFYSLVQSPQQLKQLLMVGGMDRYFQLAKCYRDEGARPDRQPEFTQLDIELSFSSCEGVITLIEELMAHCWPSEDLPIPFPRIKYRDAIENYGTDKPDLRFEPEIKKVDNLLPNEESSKKYMFPKEWKTITARALKIPCGGDNLRSQMKTKIEELKHKMFAETWLSVFKVPDNINIWQNTIERSKIPLCAESVWKTLELEPSDLLFLSIGEYDKVLDMLGRLRSMYFQSIVDEGIATPSNQRLVWVVDFPLFFRSAGGALESAHHPFTQPHPADVHLLDSRPLEVRGLHYDLVMDGCEIGGGSERIHDPVLQKRILEKYLDIPTESLSHLLDALSYGAPPHAGIALGIDRLISLICETPSIRDVMAFPKGSDGRDQMCNAPSAITEHELTLYSLKLREDKLRKEYIA